ncbi:MAG: SLC26A/SulP transporter family protein [Armatimonadetes bacterium]|nr:SLC26A/SulP transporter family protein [Armatimonadota bacterium]
MTGTVSRNSPGVMGDVFGGLAAMLVAFPSAIAFGLLVYSPLGAAYSPIGVMAGIMGTIVLGIVASAVGGSPRLVSAPCAPAAAVLAALVAEVLHSGNSSFPAEAVPAMLIIVALLSGALQFLYGVIGGGRLIKFIPYPVVAGYLSGVGVLIFTSQVPKFLGLPKGTDPWYGLLTPALWNWQGITVGLVTIVLILLAPRLTRAVPATILALSGGVIAYFAVAQWHPALLTLSGNPLVIGSVSTAAGMDFLGSLNEGLGFLGAFNLGGVRLLIVPALTLSVLLSIDTLKTCVVMDALTRSRHNSNRTLIAQGLGNTASALAGGMPGAGAMGPTLVNLTSGGATYLSGILVGVFALATFLLLGKLVAWVPIAALAGILIVVALRMIDRDSFKLLRQKSTVLDFVVIAAVVLTAVGLNLIAAAGVGVGLAILLLEARGQETIVFELRGSLFFGTTDQLFTELEPYLPQAKYIIMDMRRVHSVDFTATHMLEQIEGQLAEAGGTLIFTNLPAALPTGQDLYVYFDRLGLVRPTRNVRIFPSLDDGLEWAEDRILEDENVSMPQDGKPLELSRIDVLAGLAPEAVAALKPFAHERSYNSGETIFRQGDAGDEVFLIRQGTVKILLPITGGKSHHLATFSRGDFFGDMSFLDRGARSADALAHTDVLVYAVSRTDFDKIAAAHSLIGGKVFSRLAYTLAVRLRQTDAELQVLQE